MLDKRYLVRGQIKASISHINDLDLQKGVVEQAHLQEDLRITIDRALPISLGHSFEISENWVWVTARLWHARIEMLQGWNWCIVFIVDRINYMNTW